MRVKVKSLLGLKVYSLDEGQRNEEIVSLTYDPKKNKIEALLVKKAGSLMDLSAIMFKNVISFGINTVIIQSAGRLLDIRTVKNYLGKRLKNKNAYFDSETGRIEFLRTVVY